MIVRGRNLEEYSRLAREQLLWCHETRGIHLTRDQQDAGQASEQNKGFE